MTTICSNLCTPKQLMLYILKRVYTLGLLRHYLLDAKYEWKITKQPRELLCSYLKEVSGN